MFSLVGILVFCSSNAKKGALDGLIMARDIIIPSLLPLLILFGFMQNSSISITVTKIFGKITNILFRLPKSVSGAILFGMIGGYPTGAILTYSLFEKDEIDKNEAQRLLRFNVNGGLPFIVTALGSGILKNTKVGVLLFASTTISALLIGIVSSLFYKKRKCDFGCLSYCNSLSTAVEKACESSIDSVLKMTAYIILFSAFCNCFSLPHEIMPIIEITNGLCKSDVVLSFPMTAFFLAFSGFCIHFQLFEIIKKVGMNYFDFFIFRTLHSVLSYFVALFLFSIFPQSDMVFSSATEITAKSSSTNYALSALLIIGSLVLVLDVDSKRKAEQL